jgi:hypothetical protein
MQQRLLALGLVKKPVTEREKRRIVREKRADEIARLMSRYDRGALYEQVWSQPCSLVSWCPPTVPRSVAQQKSLDRLVVRAVSGGARTGHWAGADRAGEAGVLRTAVPSTGSLSRLCSEEVTTIKAGGREYHRRMNGKSLELH